MILVEMLVGSFMQIFFDFLVGIVCIVLEMMDGSLVLIVVIFVDLVIVEILVGGVVEVFFVNIVIVCLMLILMFIFMLMLVVLGGGGVQGLGGFVVMGGFVDGIFFGVVVFLIVFGIVLCLGRCVVQVWWMMVMVVGQDLK